MICEQKNCTYSGVAEYKMFWPGSPPTFICEKCKPTAENIAEAMGFYLHFEKVANLNER